MIIARGSGCVVGAGVDDDGAVDNGDVGDDVVDRDVVDVLELEDYFADEDGDDVGDDAHVVGSHSGYGVDDGGVAGNGRVVVDGTAYDFDVVGDVGGDGVEYGDDDVDDVEYVDGRGVGAHC